MMGRKGLLTLAVLLVAIAIASPAQAGKLYAGASLSQSTADISLNDLDDGSFTSGSIDDSDTGYRAYLGYRFLKFFALEADIVELGEFSYDAVSDGSGLLWAAGPVTATAEAEGYRLSALGILPVGKNFSIFGKFGIFAWDADTVVTDGSGTISNSADGEDEFFGAGVAYDLPGPLSLRLEYELLSLDTVDVDTLSVGAAFRF